MSVGKVDNIVSFSEAYNFLATRSSSGLYSCRAVNEIGSSKIIDVATVYVEDVPEVILDIEPLTPVR